MTGALALAVVGSGVANASADCASVVTSGQGTVFMTKAYINNMAAHNISMQALNSVSVTDQGSYTTTIWNTAGGDANLKACTGFVQLAGGTLVTNTATGQQLLLDSIRWDVANDSIDYTVQTPAGAMTIVAMDLAGTQSGRVNGDNATYSASAIYLNRSAAATMDGFLGTTAFEDTELFGWFSTTFQMSRGTSPAHVHCG